MSLLKISDLTLDLQSDGRTRRILHNVGLTIEPGETLALVGESGSGKSMTARSIIRLLPTQAELNGRIDYNGANTLDLNTEELRLLRQNEIGMIFQDPRASINPVRTVGDFLVEGLLLKGITRGAAVTQALESLDAVRIPNAKARMKAYPHELSGGMLQRVMIASVIQARHRLILADEATSALDVTTQAEVVAILSALQESHGLAMLFITHDLDLAASLCHKTAVIHHGRIVEVQASQDLYQSPQHEYTAQLLAARPSLTGGRQRG